jgi:hypothetical protein
MIGWLVFGARFGQDRTKLHRRSTPLSRLPKKRRPNLLQLAHLFKSAK